MVKLTLKHKNFAEFLVSATTFEPCNFAFTHKLFIDHLKVLETSYLDLDLQCQICQESLNVCVIHFECNYFRTVLNLPLKLCFDYCHHPCLRWIPNWCPWPWPSRSNWPSKFNRFLKKNEPFSLHLQTWSVNWSSIGFMKGVGWGQGGGDACFLRMQFWISSNHFSAEMHF